MQSIALNVDLPICQLFRMKNSIA